MRVLSALLLTFALVSSPARASDTRDLDLSVKLDVPLFAVGLAGALVPELGKSAFAPETCRVCHRGAGGELEVNAFDRAIRNAAAAAIFEPVTWAKTSDVFAYILIPLGSLVMDFTLAHDARLTREFGTDLAVIAQSLLLTASVTQIVKFSVGRQRPFVAADAPWADSLRRSNETSADDNLSFFSGHSSLSMSVAMASARTIELRTGRKLGYAVLLPLAGATAFMRLGADKHWGSDVLVGLAVGAALGWLIPTLHASATEF